MARQLTLELPVRAALGRDDFFVSDANAAAVARIEDWANWPLGKLALIGPPGSGKTHLAHVWASLSGGEVVPLADVGRLDPGALTGPLAIDGLGDALPAETETLLFHIHNALAAAGLPLLLTGQSGPARWPIALPDLASRFSAADIARIEAPDDALLAAVLLKLFSDRQLLVSPMLVQWLTGRIERSFEAARQVVATLDEAALAAGKPITRAFAATVLDLGTQGSTP